jgi:tetratricopeptide (TPR) repeat protein
MEMGRVEDAVGHYGQAVALAPDSMDAHYRMAQALARGGQIAAAIDSLGKALAIAQATGQEAAARQIAAVLRACQSQAGARGR